MRPKSGLRAGQHDDAALPSPSDDDPDASTSPGALSTSFDSPVRADWSTLNAPVRAFHVRGDDVARSHRTMSPGTSSRPGVTRQPTHAGRVRRPAERAAAFRRRRQPALLRKARQASTTNSAVTTARSELTEDSRQDHDQLEHPRRQPPEFRQELEDRMPLLHSHFIEAVLLAADVHLRTRKSRLRIYLQRRERIGDRFGCYVGHLGSYWRHARSLLFGIDRGRVHRDHPPRSPSDLGGLACASAKS